MFVDSGFNYNVKELPFPMAGKHMFLHFQSGLFQFPSTSSVNAVLKIYSPRINTFTNWCIISLQQISRSISTQLKLLFLHDFMSLCRNHGHFTSSQSLGLKDNVCCIPRNISACLQWFGIKTKLIITQYFHI